MFGFGTFLTLCLNSRLAKLATPENQNEFVLRCLVEIGAALLCQLSILVRGSYFEVSVAFTEAFRSKERIG